MRLDAMGVDPLLLDQEGLIALVEASRRRRGMFAAATKRRRAASEARRKALKPPPDPLRFKHRWEKQTRLDDSGRVVVACKRCDAAVGVEEPLPERGCKGPTSKAAEREPRP